jgi:para-nitrobenzyl esterase
VSPERLLKAQEWVMKPSLFFNLRDEAGRDPAFGITRFLPVHGDDVLPVFTLDALAQGAARDVDLLIGSTLEESNLFLAPGGLKRKIGRLLVRFMMSQGLAKGRQALAAYGFDEKGAKPGEVLARAWTDLMFRWMVRRTAELHHGRSWVYEFDWRSPAFGGELGAAHAIELPFVFDNLACASGERGILGLDPPQALADRTHALWIAFATNGTAPWPQFDGTTRQVYYMTRWMSQPEPVMPAAAFLP